MVGDFSIYKKSNRMLTQEVIEKLLSCSISSFLPLGGGRNNQVASFILDENRLIAKFYFKHDAAQRLTREKLFLEYSNSAEIKYTPRLHQTFPSHNILLQTYIAGTKPTKVTEDYLASFCKFILDLNSELALRNIGKLPMAADALLYGNTLSMDISKRLSILESSTSNITKLLLPKFKDVFETLVNLDSIEVELRREIESSGFNKSVIVSPSDFGIHNSIIDFSASNYYFYDFEFAGLDSPIKLFLDFVSHPQIHVDNSQVSILHSTLYRLLGFNLDMIEEEYLRGFALKWCLIMLRHGSRDISESDIRSYAARFGIEV